MPRGARRKDAKHGNCNDFAGRCSDGACGVIPAAGYTALIAKNAELLVEQDRVTRWEHVAEGFERIAKENEKEFAEALRRCDRLSEALQQSEDTVVRLRQELEQERSRGVDARELRNILSYNGTDEGQEEIN